MCVVVGREGDGGYCEWDGTVTASWMTCVAVIDLLRLRCSLHVTVLTAMDSCLVGIDLTEPHQIDNDRR